MGASSCTHKIFEIKSLNNIKYKSNLSIACKAMHINYKL